MSVDDTVLQLILVIIMLVSVVGFFVQRIVLRKSIGIRATQFMTVVLIIPAILILAIAEILSPDVFLTLFGAIIGYVLANIHGDKENTSND